MASGQPVMTVPIGNLLFGLLCVFTSAFPVMLAAFTMTMFTASDFGMGGPPVKVRACRRELDVSSLAGSEVGRGCRAEFCSV